MATIVSRPSTLASVQPGAISSLGTLSRRRFQLSVRTPRELFVPLVTPILFALVIAPALRVALHTPLSYEAYVAIGTIGLLIPLNAMFSGLSVIVDREAGAQRELLAAPVPRSMLVFGNLVVVIGVTAIQILALFGAAAARSISFDLSVSGLAWFVGASLAFTIGMYGVAEILASRVPQQEEYIARVPAVAIVPWFLAGSLFPITALPTWLTWLARVLPITHALALMRYGTLGDAGPLHDIWGMGDATAMAALSLAVVAVFAGVMLWVSVRVFARAAMR